MISTERVNEIFMDCFPKEGESKDEKDIIIISGIMSKIGFNPKSVDKYSDEITEMLKDFPDEFYSDKGGGWSFLNFCNTKDGAQWAEHQIMEMLIVLGMAIGKVAYTLPRDMWSILPGGVPYIVIDLKGERWVGIYINRTVGGTITNVQNLNDS